ncbi:multidrug transporter MatE [Bradyrhizobium sp. CCBAU 11445]|uniref:MATE family efflux transporter n=1 Tax=Bradyrhizobium sp. CCBAU 11445 TaxID=1630896 RepID=UPI002306DC6C|nr:MATE family efflux transporter [Bradyrhizobium sp. CCBAU 11445]MDA9481409.1 multidrug transporter MatE [Bradyrhizobium sp. CCBAU 11445]
MTRHDLAMEFKETAKIAFPSALTELGQVMMVTTDLVFIAHISVEAVAAAALAGRVYFIGFSFGMGLTSAVAPLVAQAFGADNRAMVQRSLRVGLWAALLLSLPIVSFLLCCEQILLALGQPPEPVRLAQQCLFGLAWGVLPALWFRALRGFMAALNRTAPVLWITLVAVPVNALLVYIFGTGKFGLPRLELVGAGLATSAVNCAMFLAALWFTTSRLPFREYHVLANLWRFDLPSMQQLIVIGLPHSMALLMEYGVSSAGTLLMGLIGTTALAANQVASQVATILFKIPIGIGIAATVRVGHAVGRNDGPGIRRAGHVAILFGIVIVAILTIALLAARLPVTEFVFGATVEETDGTVELAAKLLVVGASCFITEAIQTIALASLRGLSDTRVPLLFASLSYWPIGFSISYVLGMKIGFGAIGVWIGWSIGSAVYAMLLVLRFQVLASRLAHEER